jgi:hypothetical protein
VDIQEIKRRLEAKHAEDYQIARQVYRETPTKLLEIQLAELEKQLPRFGDALPINTDLLGEYQNFCPNDVWVYLEKDPPKEEWIDEDHGYGWTDEHGREFFSQVHAFGTKIDLMTTVRAIRDELAHRLNREFIHEVTDYDS